ncbi:CASP8 and FADD-like apoptosis regulator isoform X2 [Eleutherodactylus coqui]|uniref:CASP8 and FADD-like apoptosis regulator isoform X2 n=1 Tax=Eleutherodactylus coqui TaxID=57060 RepID=UPI00346295EE
MVTRDESYWNHKKYLRNCAAAAEGNIVMSVPRITSRALIQIGEELESDEEEVIKYACKDISSKTNMLELLTEVNEGNPQPVILELLYLVKRFDLIKKHYKMTKAEVERLLTKQFRVISDYRSLIIELNEQVEESELEALVFLLKYDLRNSGMLKKNKTFLSLMVDLEKHVLLATRIDLLENVFETIHRVDLQKKVLKFQQKDNVNCGGPYVNAHPAAATTLTYRIRSSTSSSMGPQIAGCSNKGTTPVQETLQQIGDHDERYLVRKGNMGFCVIIDCIGNDAEMLRALFRSLHFVVHCHLYKRVEEVEDILQGIANMEQHKNHDIFACFVVSRGNTDSLFCLDGNLPGLSLDRIKNIFTGQSCPNLRGKPKLFFIQNYFVCDIEESHEGSFVEVDCPGEDAASCQRSENTLKIPNEADIFWSHCRVDEMELQRSSGSPSLYLRSLRDLLSEKETRKHRDLLDIHTELNRIIYTKQAGYSLQLRHTLTKKLFLYPV